MSPGAAARSAPTSSPSGAVSERMSLSIARSPRASMTAIPWSAMVPDTRTTSPGRTLAGVERPPGRDLTHPRGRDEQPVGRAAAHHLGVTGDDVHPRARARRRPCRRRWLGARRSGIPPRSRTQPRAISEPAPCTARSFTVPCTARWPMDPPGKRSGCTTNASVLNASREPSARVRVAASGSDPGSPSTNAARNTESTSAADALPPAPCARVTTSSRSRGRRRRNSVIRSSTAASRSDGSGAGSDTGRILHQSGLHVRPQLPAHRRLDLLDAVDAVGPDHEADVEITVARHLTSVVSGDADRVQAGVRRVLECSNQVARVPAGRQRRGPRRRARRARSAAVRRPARTPRRWRAR